MLERISEDISFQMVRKPNRILSNRASCCSVHSSTPLADSPTRRRGNMSLLIRRDATLRISGTLHLGIFEQPGKMSFSTGNEKLTPLIQLEKAILA